MKTIITVILILLIASALVVPSVQAMETSYSVNKISYCGYLIDRNSGLEVNSPISITFRIYYKESGGTPIWEETHSSVNVQDGYFDVNLGSNNALSSIGFNSDVWLGVEVNADGEMTPRHQLPNLESQIPAASGSANSEQKPEQIDFGQFGHAVIEISIDYSDIRSGSDESPPPYIDEELAIISSTQLKLPQVSVISYVFDNTILQSIPIEDERVFDVVDFKVYSNSPRAPGT